MVDSGRPPELKQFKGTVHAISTIYKQGGILSFYKVCNDIHICLLKNCFWFQGVFSNIFRSTSGALVLVLYDEILHYTDWKQKLGRRHDKKDQ